MSGIVFKIDQAAVLRAGDAGIADAVDLVGKKIVSDAKRFVPTDTTALQRKIGGTGSGKGTKRVYTIGVLPGVVATFKGVRDPSKYWTFVERGTSVAPAQPFFRPAFYANVGR